MHALDARLPTHVPPPLPMGPYTVVRGRRVFNFQTVTGGDSLVILLGAHANISSAASPPRSVSNQIAIIGSGINVPGTTETTLVDTVMTPYTTAPTLTVANYGLHALTANIVCTSGPLATSGSAFIGTVSQRVNRLQYASYNLLAAALTQRRDLRPFTLYNLTMEGKTLSSYPVDMITWCEQNPGINASAVQSENITTDALSQICIVIPSTAAALDMTLTVYTEWRVNFTDAALASTSVKRPNAPQSLWNEAITFGNQVSGFVSDAAGIISGLQTARSSVGAAMGTISKAGSAMGELGGLLSFI